MRKTFETTAFILIYSLGIAVVFLGLATAWDAYGRYCNSKDVLQWDGNSRFIRAFDQYQDVIDRRYLRAASLVFDGDTYPPLRLLVQLAVFLLSPAGPSTHLDVAITFATWGLVFAVLLVGAMAMIPGRLAAAAVFLAASTFLMHTAELQGYGLAAMLEAQGMLFGLFTTIVLFRLYKTMDEPLTRTFKILIASSVLGMFFTKYPYGVMIILAVAFFEFARDPKATWAWVLFVLKGHYRGVRLVLVIAIGLLVAAILFAGSLGFTGLNKKWVKQIMYLAVLAAFVDFNVFLYRRRTHAGEDPAPPTVLARFYVYGFAPGIAWILLNPDRFGSIIGGQFWILKQTNSFLKSFVVDVFDSPQAIILLIVLSLGCASILFVRAARKSRAPKAAIDPLFAVTSIVLLQFVLQEVFSPNKQYRHMYHLVPAAVLVLSAWIVRLKEVVMETGPARVVPDALLRMSSVAILCSMSLWLLLRDGGLFSATYTGERPFCYTGVDSSRYADARWTARQVDPKGRYIVINLFHELPPDPGGNNQASEIDVLLRARVLGHGRLRNDNAYRWKTWDEFDRLVVIGSSCTSSDVTTRVEARAAATHSLLEPQGVMTQPQGRICVAQYALKKK